MARMTISADQLAHETRSKGVFKLPDSRQELEKARRRGNELLAQLKTMRRVDPASIERAKKELASAKRRVTSLERGRESKTSIQNRIKDHALNIRGIENELHILEPESVLYMPYSLTLSKFLGSESDKRWVEARASLSRLYDQEGSTRLALAEIITQGLKETEAPRTPAGFDNKVVEGMVDRRLLSEMDSRFADEARLRKGLESNRRSLRTARTALREHKARHREAWRVRHQKHIELERLLKLDGSQGAERLAKELEFVNVRIGILERMVADEAAHAELIARHSTYTYKLAAMRQWAWKNQSLFNMALDKFKELPGEHISDGQWNVTSERLDVLNKWVWDVWCREKAPELRSMLSFYSSDEDRTEAQKFVWREQFRKDMASILSWEDHGKITSTYVLAVKAFIDGYELEDFDIYTRMHELLRNNNRIYKGPLPRDSYVHDAYSGMDFAQHGSDTNRFDVPTYA